MQSTGKQMRVGYEIGFGFYFQLDGNVVWVFQANCVANVVRAKLITFRHANENRSMSIVIYL